MTTFSIDPDLAKRHPCWLGKIEWRDTVVTEDPLPWEAELLAAAEQLRQRFPDKADLATEPCILSAREAYQAYGVNPKRYPASAEALAKRALGGKPIPAINTMVDLNNLLSASTFCSVGSYDRSQIHGPVRFQLGGSGESYAAIGNDLFSIENFPVFADELGPFGCPTRDSLRTMVKPGATEVVTLVIAFVEPAVRGLEDLIRPWIERAGAKGIARGASFEWVS